MSNKLVGQKRFGPGDFSVGLVNEALAMLGRYGFSPGMLKRVADLGSGAAKLIVDLLSVVAKNIANNIFRVFVDYSQSLMEMLELGRYNSWDSRVEENFDFPNSDYCTELDIELIRFDRAMTTDEIVHMMAVKNFRPTTLSELLAFGATYPEKQREFDIVALGTIGRDDVVVFLWGNEQGRGLMTERYHNKWNCDFRFAAVRKT